jgi:hypothetical protein
MKRKQNEGFTLQKFSFTVDDKTQTGQIDLETITDDAPEIGTKASVDGKNANVTPKKEITLIDTIEYKGLKKGETYTAKGKLVDKKTGEVMKDAEGKEITAEAEKIAAQYQGVEVEQVKTILGEQLKSDVAQKKAVDLIKSTAVAE